MPKIFKKLVRPVANKAVQSVTEKVLDTAELEPLTNEDKIIIAAAVVAVAAIFMICRRPSVKVYVVK